MFWAISFRFKIAPTSFCQPGPPSRIIYTLQTDIFDYYNFKLIIRLFLDVMPFQSFERM